MLKREHSTSTYIGNLSAALSTELRGLGGSVAQQEAAEILALDSRKRTGSRQLRTHVVVLPVTEELSPFTRREVAMGDVAGFRCPGGGIDAPHHARA